MDDKGKGRVSEKEAEAMAAPPSYNELAPSYPPTDEEPAYPPPPHSDTPDLLGMHDLIRLQILCPNDESLHLFAQYELHGGTCSQVLTRA